jgi:periplasmic protein TonB
LRATQAARLPPSVFDLGRTRRKRFRHGSTRMSEHLHGWPGSTATGLSSVARAFLISLCVHAALIGAVWRFASTQQRRPSQRDLRIELTSSRRPPIAAASTPAHGESKPDRTKPKSKERREVARAYASVAQPAKQGNVVGERDSIRSSPARDAGVPLGAELREHQESSRSIDLRVLDWLARYRTYPLEARRARIEGVVQLRVTLMADGSLVDARVEQSSGHPLLDRAALDLLARASPLPDEFGSGHIGQIELQLPIVYRMRAPSS